jgi:photosystem II stability/assembly factor-like uncharacterized protein
VGRQRLIPVVLVAVAALVVAGCTTWTSQSVPSGTGPRYGISCPSVTHCVASGAGPFLTTDNGGTSWSSHPVPAGEYTVSCPTTTYCVAGTGVNEAFGTAPPPPSIFTSSDGGTTWNGAAGSPPFYVVEGISCGSATFCVASGLTPPVSGGPYGAIVRSNDGGATWVTPGNGPGGGPVYGVSCPSATFCVAVGGANVFTTTDGAVTWGVHTFPGLGFYSVSCASVSTCVAGGSTSSNPTADLIATTDGGTTWVSQTPPSPPPESIAGISCASATTCVAVGNNSSTGGAPAIIDTTDGGTTWTNEVVPSNVGAGSALNAISCPSPSSCTAVGSDAQGNGLIIRTG